MCLGTAADHQPALGPSSAAHGCRDVKEETQMHADGGVQAAMAASEAAAASSSAAVAPAEPVGSPPLQLPPVVLPCFDAELCQRACESVDHPGPVSSRALQSKGTK
jgi:hypothetical protein